MNPRIMTIAALLLSLLAGCSDSKVGQVTGKVTLDGQPLKSAQIEYQPESGAPSYGETDADGEFELHYTRQQKGALIGQHTVRIKTGGEIEGDDGETVYVTERLPLKFHRESELVRNVERGKNRHEFKLSLD